MTENTDTRRGLIFLLSSPSGAGKSTLAQLLLNEFDDLTLSISATTRPRRSSEVDGKHYHFRDKRAFQRMIDNGELLEWAEVHGNYYGTPSDLVSDELASGRDVLFDIDVQGTRQVREAMPDDLATIFILPPSIEEMKSRLRRRAEDSDEVIARRLKTAVSEMQSWQEYDYIVVNKDLDHAFQEVKAILTAERLRESRQRSNASLAQTLYDDLVRETS